MKIYFFEWGKSLLLIETFFGCPGDALIRRLKLKSSSGYGATIISVPSGKAKVNRTRMITTAWRSFLFKIISHTYIVFFVFFLALSYASSFIRCAVMCVVDKF